MAENTELREIPGRPGFYYVIKWVNGTAVEKSGIINMIAYEQQVMDKLGIAQEDMKNIGRAIVDGHLEGTVLKDADSKTNDYPKIMGDTITFTGTMHPLPDAHKLFDSFVPDKHAVEIGIESAELRELLERGKMAFELLSELIGEIDDPHVTPECLFCGCLKGYLYPLGHYNDCVYIRAKKFIEGNQ